MVGFLQAQGNYWNDQNYDLSKVLFRTNLQSFICTLQNSKIRLPWSESRRQKNEIKKLT